MWSLGVVAAFLQVAGFCSLRFKMSNSFNQIVSEKLDKNNFLAWKFRMKNFLKGKGYWDFIKGDNENAPVISERNPSAEERKALKDWQQGQSKVMYWLSMSITDGMMG